MAYRDIDYSLRVNGDLSVPSHSLKVGSNITLNGADGKLSATQFAGDGSLLANLSSTAMTDVLKLDGSRAMTGSLTIKPNGSGNAIYIEAVNNNSIIRVGNNTVDYGFDIKYTGAEAGINNSLEIWTDGTGVGGVKRVLRIQQDGILRVDQSIESSGNVTAPTINAALNLQEAGTNLSAKYEPIGTLHDDRYYTETEMDTKLGTKSSNGHKHVWADLTDKPTTFAPSAHTHDDRYYTEAEMDTKLGDKSAATHTHMFSALTAKPTTLVGYGITDAATSGHHHDENYLKLAGGTISGTLALNSDKLIFSGAHLSNKINLQGGNNPYLIGTESGSITFGKHTTMAAFALGHKFYNATELIASIGVHSGTVTNPNRFDSEFKGNLKATSFNVGATTVIETDAKIAWDKLKNTPASFTPSAHTHLWAHLTDKPTTFAPSAHNHDDLYFTEAEVNTKLEAKSDTTHTHDGRYYTETEMDTKLGTKSDANHTHDDRYYTETEVNTKLNLKSDTSHNHDADYLKLTGGTMAGNVNMTHVYQSGHGTPRSNLGNPTITEMALFDSQFTNKTWFYNPDYVTFEYTMDGAVWETQTHSVNAVKDFVSGKNNSSVSIPNQAIQYRITLSNNGSYVFLNALYMYWSSNSHSTKVHIDKKSNAVDAEWITHTSATNNISAWPGHMYLPFGTITFSQNAAQYSYVRIVFTPNWATTGTYANANISLNGMEIWGGYPSGKRTIYNWDRDQNVIFPAMLSASTFKNMAGDEVSFQGHDHDDRYYTETEVDLKLGAKSDSTHLHDDRYYTETEMDTKLGTKSDTSHLHDDRYYTEGEVDSKLSGKSDTTHLHDSRYLQLTGGALTGDLNINSGTNTTVTVQSGDAGEAVLNLIGSAQGTGRLYVGQSLSHGGGIEYNGDGVPSSTGAGQDYVNLYRMSSDILYWTARNFHASNDWEFRADVQASSFSIGTTPVIETDAKISWDKIKNTPATYAPSAHTHLWAHLTDKPTTFTPSAHNHDDRYYTETEVDTKLLTYDNHITDYNDYVAAPPAPTLLDLLEIDDEVQVSFTLPDRNKATHYEVWSSVGVDNNYGLMAMVKDSDIVSTDTTLTILDNTYDRKATIYYKVYAANNSAMSTALTGSIVLVNVVPDPSNMSVIQGIHDLTVQYEVPNDRRLQGVQVYAHAAADTVALSEASSTLVYSGMSDTFIYGIVAADIDKYHQFWVSSITRS